MTKMTKIKINARRKEQSAERKVKNAQRQLTNAQLESQVAALEEQIALLQGEIGKFSQGNREDVKTESLLEKSPLEKSPLEKEVPLPVPVIRVTALGSDGMRVDWEPVEHAWSVLCEWGDSTGFDDLNGTNVVAASVTSVIFRGLVPDTTHYVRVKALARASEGWQNSAFSEIVAFKTGSAPEGNGVTGDLQNWLNEEQSLFQNMAVLLPQLDDTVLTTSDRRRLQGSGVRRYGFIDKVSDVATDYPQFWPGSVNGTVDFQDAMKDRLREIEALRNLLIWLRYVTPGRRRSAAVGGRRRVSHGQYLLFDRACRRPEQYAGSAAGVSNDRVVLEETTTQERHDGRADPA